MQNNKKERIAVCFFGLPRGNPIIWKNLISSLSINYHPEYFVHTWTIAKPSLNWHGIDKLAERSIYDLFKILAQTKSLKSFNIELQGKYSPETILSSNGTKIYYSNQKNMFLSMSRSLRGLKRYQEIEDCGYDKIILIRTDLILKNPMMINDCNQSAIYHCGHMSKDRLECEDLILILKDVDIRNLIDWPKIYSPEIFDKSIYNLLPYFCNAQNIQFYPSGYEYGKDYTLYRHTSISVRARKYLRKSIDLTREILRF